jgi:hypothetical protein
MQGLTPSHILAQTGIIKSLVFYDKAGNVIENWQNHTTKMPYEQLPGYTYEETQEIYEKIMDVLCHPGFIGDMFQVCFACQIAFSRRDVTVDFALLNEYCVLSTVPECRPHRRTTSPSGYYTLH